MLKSLIICLLLIINGQVLASEAKGSNPPGQAQRAGGAATPNQVTQAAFAKGVLKCSSRLQQVTNFASPKGTQTALLTFFPMDPDNGLLSVIQEIEAAEGPGYVSSNFAPNQANGCQASYDAVSFWKKSCQLVASEVFKELKEIKDLKGSIKVLDGGPYLKVVLMPADRGCVSIKKEVIY